MKLALVSLLAMATLTGCSSGDQTSTISDPDAGGPLIEFSRSGGIAFTVQQLVVRSDGAATLTLTEAGKPRSEEIELSDEELESLTAAVEAVDPGEVDVDTESGCADCYTYAFTFNDGTKVEFDQSIETPPGLEPLLAELTAIVDANSPPNATGA